MGSEPRTWEQVLDEHERVLAGMRDACPVLDAIVDAIVAALRGGRRVYVCGNGGSAADAQHIACELLGRFRRTRRALPVIALTTDTSTLTAVANDLGYESVFARQVEALVQPGDVLWVLSTSGRSPNVLAAARLARERDAVVVGFTGRTGGDLAGLCTHVLRVPHDRAERIQEVHLLAYHYVCERVEAALA